MSEVIYVIVQKDTGIIARVSGPRRTPAYTSKGRAVNAMRTHRLSEGLYEVAEFVRKEDD